MKKSRDELEAELRSLMPSTPSERVIDGIAARLSATTSSSEQDSWNWGAMALAVAACVSFVILSYPRSTDTTSGPPLPSVGPQVQSSQLPSPTMMAYRQVFLESPDALDQLLDRHASHLLASNSSGNEMEMLVQDLWEH